MIMMTIHFISVSGLLAGQKMFPARHELATLHVWGTRDNHYTTETTLALTLALLAIYSVFISQPRSYTVPWGSFARREKMAAKALSINALRYRT